jgi:hypothetical protein
VLKVKCCLSDKSIRGEEKFESDGIPFHDNPITDGISNLDDAECQFNMGTQRLPIATVMDNIGAARSSFVGNRDISS